MYKYYLNKKSNNVFVVWVTKLLKIYIKSKFNSIQGMKYHTIQKGKKTLFPVISMTISNSL